MTQKPNQKPHQQTNKHKDSKAGYKQIWLLWLLNLVPFLQIGTFYTYGVRCINWVWIYWFFYFAFIGHRKLTFALYVLTSAIATWHVLSNRKMEPPKGSKTNSDIDKFIRGESLYGHQNQHSSDGKPSLSGRLKSHHRKGGSFAAMDAIASELEHDAERGEGVAQPVAATQSASGVLQDGATIFVGSASNSEPAEAPNRVSALDLLKSDLAELLPGKSDSAKAVELPSQPRAQPPAQPVVAPSVKLPEPSIALVPGDSFDATPPEASGPQPLREQSPGVFTAPASEPVKAPNPVSLADAPTSSVAAAPLSSIGTSVAPSVDLDQSKTALPQAVPAADLNQSTNLDPGLGAPLPTFDMPNVSYSFNFEAPKFDGISANASTDAKCPKCGAEMNSNFSFCLTCGYSG